MSMRRRHFRGNLEGVMTMHNEKDRVLAHELCRELTVEELDAIAGGLMCTATSVCSNGGCSHDKDN